MTQFQIFAGIDWSAKSHQVAVIDADGKILGEQAFAHSGEGLAAMADWILGHGPEGSVAAAIEKPHGPEVEALLERGAAVFALNPKQLDRLRRPLRVFRDRFSPAGAKDDRRDALVLASALSTDRKAFREVETPSPEIIRLRELSRADSDLVAERTCLINKLKAHLRRYYPAFLEAAPDLGTDWALRLWELAPTPDRARRVRKASVEAAGRIVKRIKDCNEEIKEIRSWIREAVGRIRAAEGGRAVEILESVPGIGATVLAVIVSEAFDIIRRADLRALRCYFGVAPVTKRSGREIRVQRRRTANTRLANAAHHRAMAAVQRDPASKAKYSALRQRGHNHARALRGVADRLLGGVCKMLETGQTFDPERQSKAPLENPNQTLDIRLRVPGGAESNGVSGLPHPCAGIATAGCPLLARWRSRRGARGFRQAGFASVCPAVGYSMLQSFIMRTQRASSTIPPKIAARQRRRPSPGIRFMVGGERSEDDHVGFWAGPVPLFPGRRPRPGFRGLQTRLRGSVKEAY